MFIYLELKEKFPNVTHGLHWTKWTKLGLWVAAQFDWICKKIFWLSDLFSFFCKKTESPTSCYFGINGTPNMPACDTMNLNSVTLNSLYLFINLTQCLRGQIRVRVGKYWCCSSGEREIWRYQGEGKGKTCKSSVEIISRGDE